MVRGSICREARELDGCPDGWVGEKCARRGNAARGSKPETALNRSFARGATPVGMTRERTGPPRCAVVLGSARRVDEEPRASQGGSAGGRAGRRDQEVGVAVAVDITDGRAGR